MTLIQAPEPAYYSVVGQLEREQLELALNLFEAAAHQALDGIDDPLRSLNKGLAGAVAYGDRGAPATCGDRIKCHDRRHQMRAVYAGNDHRRIALHISDQGIRGSQVNSNYASFRHAFLSSSKGFSYVTKQIAEVATPVEQGDHFLLRGLTHGCVTRVPNLPLGAKVVI